MKKTLLSLGAAAVISAMSAVAQADTCEQCGGGPPPPPPTLDCRGIKSNSGIGNRGEGRGNETRDCDPGNSCAHNQAWKNAGRPRNGGGRSF